MKKLLKLLPFACLLLAASGCKKTIRQWDYPNVNIRIYVDNPEGADLLSAITEGNMFNNNIIATYDGQTLRCQWPKYPTTRAEGPDMPTFDGLVYSIDGRERKSLTLGEFSIDTKDYRGEKFTINWGDGQSTEFEFDLWHTDNGDDEPTVHRAIRATGGTVGVGASSDNALVITIVKDK